MANTYTCLHYHIVFSTKNRLPWITADIESRVWEYIGGIARQNMMKALKIGGVDDHIHLLLGAGPTVNVSKAVQLIKGGSSKWIHDTFLDLQQFEWQKGYGAFSVSASQLPDVDGYIAKQREHHKKRSFKEEFLTMLKKHGIDYDEQYVWG